MLLDIATRAEESLFLAAPQSNSDRSARLDSQRIKNAHHLHGDQCSRAVVGCASTRSPRVEMAAHHHHFILQLRIGAWNLGHRIVSRLMIAKELRIHIQLDAHGHIRFQEP